MEILGWYKKLNILPNFFRTFFGSSGPEFDDVKFYGQSKINPSEKCTYYTLFERWFSTDHFLLKNLSVHDSCSCVRGSKMKNYDVIT